MTPTVKAALMTIILALAGLGDVVFFAPRNDVLVPQTFFFIVLLINTYFSVRFYSAIQPQDMNQMRDDAAIVVLYLALTASLGHAILFAGMALLLFILAVSKYALMLGIIPYTQLLRRKILIDLTGALACAALLLGTIAGYSLIAAWALAILFTLANIYLLAIKPMYRL